MKRLFITLSVVMLLAAFKNKTVNQNSLDLSHIQEFIPANNVNYYADSINGYSTFSAENNIVIVPEEITKKQYKKMLTDKYVFRPEKVNPNTALYAKLDKKTQKHVARYDSLIGYCKLFSFFYYKETKQYECCIEFPLTFKSFMMTEDGIIDSTFMISDISSYGTNKIFVGQEGHDCDFHGDLWFYWYDEKNCRMVPICHYVDYRWNEETNDFDLCWIGNNELLVSAISDGNSGVYGCAGGYRKTGLAPYGTPVYYKLRLTVQ